MQQACIMMGLLNKHIYIFNPDEDECPYTSCCNKNSCPPRQPPPDKYTKPPECVNIISRTS